MVNNDNGLSDRNENKILNKLIKTKSQSNWNGATKTPEVRGRVRTR